MELTAIDTLLWEAALAGGALLLAVLIWRGRWRQYPAFLCYVACQVVSNPIGMILFYVLKSPRAYSQFYWGAAIVDFALQLAVVVELARIVLRPTGTWVRDAKKQFVLSAFAGTAIAVACAAIVTPPSKNLLDSFEVRGELFSSLIVCELVIATTMASNRLGLGWRSHVMAIGQGLMVWSVVAVVVDGFHSYFGRAGFFTSLEHVRMVTYLAALCYWSVQLWHEEPVRQPISAELHQYIIALHHRVNYDLGEAKR
jgi:hypothetical protein